MNRSVLKKNVLCHFSQIWQLLIEILNVAIVCLGLLIQ